MKLKMAVRKSGMLCATLGSVLLLSAGTAWAAPRGAHYGSIEYKKNLLEAEKERLELRQDWADDKIGGRRAEHIKARLENKQDLIDDKIRKLDRRQDRVRDRRHHNSHNSNYDRHNGRRTQYYGPVRGGTHYRPVRNSYYRPNYYRPNYNRPNYYRPRCANNRPYWRR